MHFLVEKKPPARGMRRQASATRSAMTNTDDRIQMWGAISALLVLTLFHNMLSLGLPVYSLQVIGRVIPTGDLTTLFSFVVLILVFVLSDMAVESSRASYLIRLSGKMALHEQQRFARKVSDIHKNLEHQEDVLRLRSYFSSHVGFALIDLPFSALFLTGLFLLHPWLGLIATAVIFVVMGSGWAAGARVHGVAQANAPSVELRRRLRPTSLLASTMSAGVTERFRDVAIGLTTSAGHVVEAQAKAASQVQGIRSIAQAGLIAVTAILIARREIPAGAMLASSMLFARAIQPFERCSDVPQLARMLRLFLAVSRRSGAVKLVASARRLQVDVAGSPVGIRSASVRYPGQLSCALRDISLDANPGEILYVAGESGSGKTALLATFAGLIKPEVGEVRLNGYAYRDLDPEVVQKSIGCMIDSRLPHSGLLLGLIAGDKAPDLLKAVDAAKLAGLHEYIQTIPAAYNAWIDHRSPCLSVGRQEQLALARAIYGRPSLIVLDEPAAYLDEQGQRALAETLLELRNDGKIILITSRSRILQATHDKVVVLRGGLLDAVLSRREIEAHVGSR